ncbi:hypothetical protein K1T71_005931 [Dendrolimus kikuchii]|uniref:Uncharacterized protein n=1 Tax=Dendrolimus kikuchii TaxID=765133 RepID=A0ACC1D3D6_9NEOP|nr:hypothetical protein K1T71_005931 [Dendrolimus kikuchii]
MAFLRNVRFVVVVVYLHTVFSQDAVPSVHLQALSPKGFRVWIVDDPKIKLFAFQGNINGPINKNDVGTISGEITEAKDGKWIFEDPNLELKIGDVINYYVFVFMQNTGYVKDGLSFTVQKLESPHLAENPKLPSCEPTITKVRGGSACASEIIFEDDFNSLNEGQWQIEKYIPKNHAEYPFISYQQLTSDPTVKVENGNLQISAKLQANLPGFSSESLYTGSLNLFQGCTAPGDLCVKRVMGADIIPPVVTGRITSKTFAFTYGTVYVRAKMPKGDWLYPEILIEPVIKKYGASDFNSGVIKIASARGNTLLYANGTDYSNKVLYGGPIMDSQCWDTLLKRKTKSSGNWGDDFHLYAMRWTPDSITLMIDNEEWARVDVGPTGIRNLFPKSCNLPRDLLSMGSNMAPFDDHFYLTLGLAAGGVTDFPDDSYTTADHPKPWRNRGRKAMLNFWQDTDWFNTWVQPQLVIDSIKVVAL